MRKPSTTKRGLKSKSHLHHKCPPSKPPKTMRFGPLGSQGQKSMKCTTRRDTLESGQTKSEAASPGFAMNHRKGACSIRWFWFR